ncbi:hypothetical protein [Methylacidiphilum caldifontis]|uniref:Uncharacterized protein n=1 Tax=Methylacidiphilum caldifontis TaxID=2795386 RepID=A0A4Y8PB52_9BACT|nr:hypothetical protein [Methylacidiphilum caldifontis]TFE68182.1 hypothetical protein A7Q10_00650 [Methylacidiphilum caldifontis]
MKIKSLLGLILFFMIGGFAFGSQASLLTKKISCNCGKRCAHAQNCFGYKDSCDHGKRKSL